MIEAAVTDDEFGAQLKAAGFEDARFEPMDGDVMIGATVEQSPRA